LSKNNTYNKAIADEAASNAHVRKKSPVVTGRQKCTNATSVPAEPEQTVANLKESCCLGWWTGRSELSWLWIVLSSCWIFAALCIKSLGKLVALREWHLSNWGLQNGLDINFHFLVAIYCPKKLWSLSLWGCWLKLSVGLSSCGNGATELKYVCSGIENMMGANC